MRHSGASAQGAGAAMRVGEVSITVPFRYTRLLFAMILGIAVFGERPDLMTWAGSAVIVASGLYTIYRSQRGAAPLAKKPV